MAEICKEFGVAYFEVCLWTGLGIQSLVEHIESQFGEEARKKEKYRKEDEKRKPYKNLCKNFWLTNFHLSGLYFG